MVILVGLFLQDETRNRFSWWVSSLKAAICWSASSGRILSVRRRGPENNIGIVGSFKHDLISSYIIIIFYLGLMCFFFSLSLYDSARFWPLSPSVPFPRGPSGPSGPWGPWGPWSPWSPWGPWGQGRVNECLLFSGLLLRTPLCDCRCPNLPVISIILHMINDCF